jgi:hypothetical protein
VRILVECCPRSGGDWTQIGPPIAPGAIRGSGTAFQDTAIVMVVFGWDDETVPGVWLDDGQAVRIGNSQRGHVTPVEELVRLADLRAGPFEMDGPNARWRWSLID